MKTLEKYYGKELAYVLTELKKGKINTNVQTKKVYDPRDFSHRVAPCSGCDLVIGDNSTESKYIFDIGGIHSDNSIFVFAKTESLTLFNYCEVEQIETVLSAQKESIIEGLETFARVQQKRVNDALEILKTL